MTAHGYRILITGSRDWGDEDTVRNALDAAIHIGGAAIGPDVTVVSGACPSGADAIAERVASEMGCEVELHPADWNAHGRAAGPRRNAEMVNLGADICLAFIGDCTSPRCHITGKHPSHGATGCADLAEKAGIPVQRYEYREVSA